LFYFIHGQFIFTMHIHKRPAYASTMPKNRIVKAPTNGLTASRDKILAALAYVGLANFPDAYRRLKIIAPFPDFQRLMTTITFGSLCFSSFLFNILCLIQGSS